MCKWTFGCPVKQWWAECSFVLWHIFSEVSEFALINCFRWQNFTSPAEYIWVFWSTHQFRLLWKFSKSANWPDQPAVNPANNCHLHIYPKQFFPWNPFPCEWKTWTVSIHTKFWYLQFSTIVWPVFWKSPNHKREMIKKVMRHTSPSTTVAKRQGQFWWCSRELDFQHFQETMFVLSKSCWFFWFCFLGRITDFVWGPH